MAAIVGSVVLSAPQAHAIKLTGSDATDDAIFGTAKTDKLKGLDGEDFLFGKGNPNKRRRGGRRVKSPDVLLGGDGPDVLFGGRGRDVLDGGRGTNNAYDEDGTPGDRLFGSSDNFGSLFSVDGARDALDCGGFEDSIAFADPVDVVTGCHLVFTYSLANTGIGVDVIIGTSGDDVALDGDAGTDWIMGGRGSDDMSGSTEADLLLGGPQDDQLNGEDGNDSVFDDDGTPGDVLDGGNGNDLIVSADGAADAIVCGADTDTVYKDPEDTTDGQCETVHEGTGALNP
jgi:Ca2+-binding RTX toxin-like protein